LKGGEQEGRTIRFTASDRKGIWSVLAVHRDDYRKGPAVKILMEFIPSPDAGLKASRSQCGYIFLKPGTDQRWFSGCVAHKLGYTPTPKANSALFSYITGEIQRLQNEDACYAGEDRQAAVKAQADLMTTAAQRVLAGEAPPGRPVTTDPWSIRTLMIWLTDDERDTAIRWQKVLNGHGAEDNEHLRPFAEQLRSAIKWAELEKARREREERRVRLIRLMDTDPDFRRFVAHYAGARGTACGSVEYELLYRLFGYCRDLDEYQERRPKLVHLLAAYGLQHDQIGELDQLTALEWDCLPVVVVPFDRKAGEFYYGDRVRYRRAPLPGEHYTSYVVNKSTRDYLYLSSGAGRVEKTACVHVALVDAA